ncbi:MAG: hypothetical protein H7Y06_05060 [Opitutaceae bacterium]|nr:hypothetical protein [Opitutaceae bacterium]
MIASKWRTVAALETLLHFEPSPMNGLLPVGRLCRNNYPIMLVVFLRGLAQAFLPVFRYGFLRAEAQTGMSVPRRAACGLEVTVGRGWNERMIYPVRWLLLVGVLLTSLRADMTGDVVRVHVEASGGREAVNALKAIKATGVTRNASGGELRFILWAARPNRIRTEVTAGERVVAQGWDGIGEPWTADSKTRKIGLLKGVAAEEYKADAQFDDPLLAGPEQRVSIEFEGEVEVDGRQLIKLIAMQNLTSMSFVYVDPVSFLVVKRDSIRRREGETVVVVRTDYSDFKPVAGVMLPHRMVVSVDGKRLNETVIETIAPNPKMPANIFTVQLGDK